MSHKIGVCRVSRDGKPCKTVFTRISCDGKSSILKCKLPNSEWTIIIVYSTLMYPFSYEVFFKGYQYKSLYEGQGTNSVKGSL